MTTRVTVVGGRFGMLSSEDRPPEEKVTGVVYRVKCRECNFSYIGQEMLGFQGSRTRSCARRKPRGSASQTLSTLSSTAGTLVADQTDAGETVREQCLQGNVISGVVVEAALLWGLSLTMANGEFAVHDGLPL